MSMIFLDLLLPPHTTFPSTLTLNKGQGHSKQHAHFVAMFVPFLNHHLKQPAWTYLPTIVERVKTFFQTNTNKLRVPNQNGVSQAWYLVEIHDSGRKPSNQKDPKQKQTRNEQTNRKEIKTRQRNRKSKCSNNSYSPYLQEFFRVISLT